MSDVNTLNVTASKPANAGGAIRRAPIGTALPTDAKSALAATYVSVGYISEDGFTKSMSPEVTSTKEWGGSIVLNDQTSGERKYKFKMLERFNDEVQKVVYGDDNVTTSTADGYTTMTVIDTDAEQEAHVWVIEEIGKARNGEPVIVRTVIPSGTVTSISDIDHKAGDPVAYEVEITAEYDSSIKGTAKTYYYYKNATA